MGGYSTRATLAFFLRPLGNCFGGLAFLADLAFPGATWARRGATRLTLKIYVCPTLPVLQPIAILHALRSPGFYIHQAGMADACLQVSLGAQPILLWAVRFIPSLQPIRMSQARDLIVAGRRLRLR